MNKHCNTCEKTVSAYLPKMSNRELLAALKSDQPIEIGHNVSLPNGFSEDHRWFLTKDEQVRQSRTMITLTGR
jgi:hypothetical protein